MEISATDVLVVVDVQNDFCPGGALAISGGDRVIDVIHRIAPLFRHVVLTQDWHPSRHVSFASAHAGRKPLDTIETPYGPQTLWPDHCVQGTSGAALHPDLALDYAQLILRKGCNTEIDSYSAFFENDHATPTGLGGYLQERGSSRVFLTGLAYDFCVGFSAIDARRLGLTAVVLKDACRAINTDGSSAKMEDAFQRSGVFVVGSAELNQGV